jgi:hypothetical protein
MQHTKHHPRVRVLGDIHIRRTGIQFCQVIIIRIRSLLLQMPMLLVNCHLPKEERDECGLDRWIVLVDTWNHGDLADALVVLEPVVGGGLVFEELGVAGDTIRESIFHLVGSAVPIFGDGIGLDLMVPLEGFPVELQLFLLVHLFDVLEEAARHRRPAHEYAAAVVEELTFDLHDVSGVGNRHVDANNIHHILALQGDIGGEERKHPRWVALAMGKVKFIFFFVPKDGRSSASARGGGHDLKR